MFWVILFLESQVFSLLFVFFVGTELLRAPAKGGARVTSAGQVVDKDLVRNLRVIKVWLCVSILNCKHVLVVKNKQKEGDMANNRSCLAQVVCESV